MNELIEYDHDSIINSLVKYSKKSEDWMIYLSLAIWIDRISIWYSIDYSMFELIYVHEYLLSMKLFMISWSLIDWEDIKTREDLILARML